MNKIVLVTIVLIVFSCKENKNESIYNLEPKPREVILSENEKYIKNSEALKLFEKGLTKIADRQYNEAKDILLKANRHEQNNIVILNALANIEGSLGNIDASIKMFYKNISLDSTHISSYTNLGQNLMLDKNYEEARRILLLGLRNGRASNLHQKSIHLINLAVSLNNLKKCDSALTYANEAIEISQNEKFLKFAEQIATESKSCNNSDSH